MTRYVKNHKNAQPPPQVLSYKLPL